MDTQKIVLNAYFEKLHDILVSYQEPLQALVRQLLRNVIVQEGLEGFSDERFDGFLEACESLILERIESYNPIGIQYTFTRTTREEAFLLEASLDWYQSQGEFKSLCEKAGKLSALHNEGLDPEKTAIQLIAAQGAYPNRSILKQYRADPSVQALPDYVVSLAIEKVLNQVDLEAPCD